MAEVALLNPDVESTVCLKMIEVLQAQLGRLEEGLTTSVLDREQYLLKIGAVTSLRTVLEHQQKLYDREFKT